MTLNIMYNVQCTWLCIHILFAFLLACICIYLYYIYKYFLFSFLHLLLMLDRYSIGGKAFGANFVRQDEIWDMNTSKRENWIIQAQCTVQQYHLLNDWDYLSRHANLLQFFFWKKRRKTQSHTRIPMCEQANINISRQHFYWKNSNVKFIISFIFQPCEGIISQFFKPNCLKWDSFSIYPLAQMIKSYFHFDKKNAIKINLYSRVICQWQWKIYINNHFPMK